MPDLLKEGHVFGEYTVYEFRIGSPDIEATEAFRIALNKQIGKTQGMPPEDAVFANISGLLQYPEIWIVFSAGLRKPIEDCKKIPRGDLIDLLPEIIGVNRYFFVKIPTMVTKMYEILMPEKTPEKPASSPETGSSSTVKT